MVVWVALAAGYLACSTSATGEPPCPADGGDCIDTASGCVDGDGDQYGPGCPAGPDCDDSDPDNWSGCPTCVDEDGDGYYVSCDAYTIRGGPDSDDSDSTVWRCGNGSCDTDETCSSCPEDCDTCEIVAFSCSYQDGSIPSDMVLEKFREDDLTVVTAPWDSGRQALRVTIRANEYYNGSYQRSEVTPYSVFKLEWDVRYRFTSGFYFPTDSEFPAEGDGIWGDGTLIAAFQHHHSLQSGSPPIAFELECGRLRVIIREDNTVVAQAYLGTGPVPVGRYVPYEIVYRPSLTDNGYVRITIDGLLVLEYVGANNYQDAPDGGYYKQGLYDWATTVNDTNAQILMVYLDDMIVYREVD